MEKEMVAEGHKASIDKFARNCEFRYLLHIDGNVASSRLASELHLGSTIFKQDSFSREFYQPLLRVHFLPHPHQLLRLRLLRCPKAEPPGSKLCPQPLLTLPALRTLAGVDRVH